MNWTMRKAGLVCILLDFLVFAALIIWGGWRGEIQFLHNEFLEYTFKQCIPICISDVMLVALARFAMILIVYVIGGVKSWIPAVIICGLVLAAVTSEGIWIIVKVDKIYLLKWTFLISSFVITWIDFSVLSASFLIERKKAELGRYIGIVKKKQEGRKFVNFATTPVEANIRENAPLLSSLEAATFLNASGKEQYLRQYMRHSALGILDTAEPQSFDERQDDTAQASSPCVGSKKVLPSIPRLIALMLDPTIGINLEKRKIRGKFHENLFSGEAAVTWVCHVMPHTQSRDEAVTILQECIHRGYFFQVENSKNSPDQMSDSPKQFYELAPDVSERLPIAILRPTISQHHSFLDASKEEDYGNEVLGSVRVVHRLFPEDDPQSSQSDLGSQKFSEYSSSETASDPSSDVAHHSGMESPGRSDEPVDEEGERPKKRKLSPLLKNFVRQMRDSDGGLSIQNRTVQLTSSEFTTYHKCFPGSDLIDWLADRLNFKERQHAVLIAGKLLENDVIVCVNPNPMMDRFEDVRNRFYRFKADS
eukprot:TRINITY_DN311_c0_g2_i1.p1 TRINITY_DN311_c0_g2~~TRINITY_DN311_c0_g2_i1.p1  ORF type:complete len:535 (+),score=153.84 TRINITY_DN311_c0_g2_i1:106-1710(+)